MLHQVTAEIWVGPRGAFTFSARDAAGERWTFVVLADCLASLAQSDAEKKRPAEVFDRYRSAIYYAAAVRIRSGVSFEQQVLVAVEFDAYSDAPHLPVQLGQRSGVTRASM